MLTSTLMKQARTDLSVLVVEDHPFAASFLKQVILGATLGRAKVQTAKDLQSAIAKATASKNVDVVFLDLCLPGFTGLGALYRFKECFPSIKIVAFSAIDTPDVIAAALRAGAIGFIPKTLGTSEIAVVVHEILNSKACRAGNARARSLSDRQSAVFLFLLEGLPNRKIAHRLGISESTVKKHISAVYGALGVKTRAQAIVAAARFGGRDKGRVR